MLHYSTIYPQTLQLLKELQQIDFIQDYILVGGTSLALQIGHRISVDLDLFAFTDNDVLTIMNHIHHLGRLQIANQTSKILNIFIDDIKVDFVSYRYAFIKNSLEIDGIRLASIEDIGAMKLAAITGRGSKKDFIDLYFILKRYSLTELFDFYNQKFPDGNNFLVFKSLTYFADAELEPMPKMILSTHWEEVKAFITLTVNKHFP
ncbi:MAG: nucleotidyl transferase AbiEii/AbiGii toxin family protein [Aureispira sp.]